jgi:hypothetical protein
VWGVVPRANTLRRLGALPGVAPEQARVRMKLPMLVAELEHRGFAPAFEPSREA